METRSGGDMLKKLYHRVYWVAFLALTLSGCSSIRGFGNALTNSFKGFSIHFP
jgi:predicted small secreted protein